jgi:L-malate glycosyltransferase
MNILLCCEFYAPSVGGVQEVMRQLAERLAARGHSVTVATTSIPERKSHYVNGVHIVRVTSNLS